MWTGEAKMKIKSIIVGALLIVISFCSCTVTEIEQKTLTENDYKYIDLVYEYMSEWEAKSYYDSGEYHTINKIAFYDFDGTGRLCFYKNYPIAAYYAVGYFIYDDRMESMDFSVYDHDENTRHRGFSMMTSVDGIDWDVKATDEEKYRRLEEAYLKYLNDED